MIRKFGKIGAFLYVTAIIAVTVFCTARDAEKNLIKEIVIEAGSRIRIEDFFNDCPEDARFVSDISGIDTNVPAVYQLKVHYSDVFEKDVLLRIEDHTAPRGIALPKEQFSRFKWPEPEECVGYLYDLSGIAKIEYQDGIPEINETGDYLVPVVVTDWYNNQTVINVPFHVINDETGPVIKGVHDLVCDGDADAMNYYDGVSVSDDYDEFPIMDVDDSQVNYEENGCYEIVYKAVDMVGNVTVITAKVTVELPVEEEEETSSEGYDDYDYSSTGDPYSLASSIMSGLWRGSDVETARAIFNWVHSHIYYQTIYGSQSYESAAYRGFSRRNGDCYVYYCCSKMLLDLAGIPNMMVTRSPVITNGHFWNLVYLNGEWYHCDATVFRSHPSVYFMCTDAEIDDYAHQFNGSLYPPRAGGSTEYLEETTEETNPEEITDPDAITDPTESLDPDATTDPNETTAQPDGSETSDPTGDTSPSSDPSDTEPTVPEETPPSEPGETEPTEPTEPTETTVPEQVPQESTETAAPDSTDQGGENV